MKNDPYLNLKFAQLLARLGIKSEKFLIDIMMQAMKYTFNEALSNTMMGMFGQPVQVVSLEDTLEQVSPIQFNGLRKFLDENDR